MDFLFNLVRFLVPYYEKARKHTRYVDPYDPEGGESDAPRKPGKHTKELKIAFLAIQDYLQNHEINVEKCLDLETETSKSKSSIKPTVATAEDSKANANINISTRLGQETEEVCKSLYNNYESENIIPLERIFLSKNWEVNALKAKQKYRYLTKEPSNNLSNKPRTYLGKVVGILKIYQRIEQKLQSDLESINETRRLETIEYEAKIEKLKMELDALEMDNWNEKQVHISQIKSLDH